MALATNYVFIPIGDQEWPFNEDQASLGEAEQKPIKLNTGSGMIEIILRRRNLTLTLDRVPEAAGRVLYAARDESYRLLAHATGGGIEGTDIVFGPLTIPNTVLTDVNSQAPFYVDGQGLAQVTAVLTSQVFA